MSKHERKTALLVIALMVAFSTASWAQQTQPAASQGQPQAQPTPPAATKGPLDLRKLFARADKNGDGKVTKDEAKGHLPITYLSFEEIDTDKRGWISFDQFVAFTNKRVDKLGDNAFKQGQGDKY
jgi:EF hand